MCKPLLFSLIKECENSNAIIRGIICDMGNQKLLKELDVYNEKFYFLNPSNNRKVYIFPDVPHCLKNLRNHCLDYGMNVIINNVNVPIVKDDFYQLLNTEHCTKLTKKHIECKQNDRQRVLYAVQLFSNSVSEAFVSKLGDLYVNISNVIKTINDWFDVMNSSTKENISNVNKNGLGLYYDQQILCLNNMLELGKSNNDLYVL